MIPTNVKSIIFWASVTIGDRTREIRKTFLTGVTRTKITKAYPGWSCGDISIARPRNQASSCGLFRLAFAEVAEAKLAQTAQSSSCCGGSKFIKGPSSPPKSERWAEPAVWRSRQRKGCPHRQKNTLHPVPPRPPDQGPNCPLGQTNLGSHPTWESFELFLSPCPTPSHSTPASFFSSLAATVFSDVYPGLEPQWPAWGLGKRGGARAQEEEFLGEASREQQMDAHSFSWHLADCVYMHMQTCVFSPVDSGSVSLAC